MKKKLLSIVAAVAALSSAGTASAQEVLTGDTRYACEAILCLASGTRPSECTPSLRKYFSITARKLSDTIRKRKNFLDLCPVSNQTPEMSALVSAMSRGAGRCDAQALNQTLVFWQGYDDGTTYISNQMPDYCAAYTNHAYTDFNSTKPRYVGTPDRGGYWVEAADYDQALAAYNERIRREDEERRRGSWGNY
ncbi:TrbM/KikA/MpfK family conjugal transfer protein [Xanthomonas arboricola]|uniref:TrbM/KikA/MpfK family conjugal transfer protein n=1 Tax=Xanthomonas arboricola TaxID=56448 RepID=UPI0003A2416E|nr:TrbM/KikA/MpfK family conjugal transfer protein [Xanthomonas arboricola]BCT99957.1 TrbM protein [uncultured bacterium]